MKMNFIGHNIKFSRKWKNIISRVLQFMWSNIINNNAYWKPRGNSKNHIHTYIHTYTHTEISLKSQ